MSNPRRKTARFELRLEADLETRLLVTAQRLKISIAEFLRQAALEKLTALETPGPGKD